MLLLLLLTEYQLRSMSDGIQRVVIEEHASNDWRLRLEKHEDNQTVVFGLVNSRTRERAFKTVRAALDAVRKNLAGQHEIVLRMKMVETRELQSVE